MIRVVIGVVLALHGLVHLWFVALALRLVTFRPEMGWSGRSWLLTPLLGDAATRSTAAVLLSAAAAAFVVGGLALAGPAAWWRPALVFAASLSTVVLLVTWDGGTDLIVQKGAIGVAINVAVLVLLAR